MLLLLQRERGAQINLVTESTTVLHKLTRIKELVASGFRDCSDADVWAQIARELEHYRLGDMGERTQRVIGGTNSRIDLRKRGPTLL